MKACCLLLSRQAIDSCSVGEKFVSVLSMASSLGLSWGCTTLIDNVYSFEKNHIDDNV